MKDLRRLGLSLRDRFCASPDREHEMALNRLIAGSLILFFNAALPFDLMARPSAALIALGYVAGGLAICVHILWRPHQKWARRQVALALDLGAVTFEMQAGAAATAWLYPAYLWVVFGNGFRFGPQQMLVAMVAAIAAFLAVIAATPFWWSKPTICAGLLLALLLIPLYAFSLLDKLSRARRQAVEANLAKSLFLAKVSHELRTPLNAIIGCGALLGDGKLDAEQREMAETILSSGRGLLSLIDSILDLSRLEAGRMPVSSAEFNLCDLLEELRRMMLVQAREKGIAVALHVSSRTPLALRGDFTRLREILLNLLSNAVKFTDGGSILLAVDVVGRGDPDQAAEAESPPVRLRFEVDDTGIGIAEDAQSRIFEIFTQADETISNRYGGTGLGLSITRQLVELLGGAIGVESQPGRGTTVWVELEFHEGPRSVQEPPDAQGARCLLVADPHGAAAPFVSRLQSLGVEVDSAFPRELKGEKYIRIEADGEEPVVFAAVRYGCEPLASSAGSPLAGDSLRFFEVAQEPAFKPASGGLRRHISTRVSTAASDAELLRALRICDALPPDKQPRHAGATPERAGRSRLVLVADDNRVNQKVMTRILERAGHRVIVAADGDEMLDMLDATQVDLLIVDVNMPNVNGIDATQIFRMTNLDRPRVPIVGLTADATLETRQRCLDAGMDICLLKPIEPAALIGVLDDLFRTQDEADEASGKAASATAARAGCAEAGRGEAASPIESIASHPRFRSVTTPIIDPATLDNLRLLGGEEFLTEIIGDFLTEMEELVTALKAAAQTTDTESFRASAHAIRSGAANIGARLLCELAERWETVSADELRRHGESYISNLVAQADTLKRALTAHKSETSRNEILRF